MDEDEGQTDRGRARRNRPIVAAHIDAHIEMGGPLIDLLDTTGFLSQHPGVVNLASVTGTGTMKRSLS
jgi:hypothetical protein